MLLYGLRKFRISLLGLAPYLARCGLSAKEIAKEMGIALSTLSEWKKSNTEFSDALKEGKSQANAEVENVRV